MKRTLETLKKEIKNFIKKLEMIGSAAAFALRN